LLFGIFIDRIEAWLESRAPGCGVKVGEQLLQLLLYADDLALVCQDTPIRVASVDSSPVV